MKKSLIAGAVLSVLSTAAFSQAASSVTLYGIVDSNFSRAETHGGVSTTGLDQLPNPRGSRFGMRGSENIGGGLRASFQLEAGLAPADGTTTSGNQLFNRQAWVGLSGGFGEVSFGRQQTLHREVNNNNYNDVATEGEISVTTANSGLQLMQNFGTRVNNAVRYTSPLFSGVRVRVQSALGQRSTASTNGLMVSYDKGPLRAAVVHEYYDGAGVTGISRWNEATMLGMQYNFGPATLALGYQKTEKLLASAAANTLTSAATLPDHSAYNIGVIVPVSKEFSLRAQYTASTTDFPAAGTTPATSRDYSRVGLSARYSLSSRTYLYGAYNERDVDVPTATQNKNSIGLGISHAF